MTEFNGKVALVTGGSRGLGKAIAKELGKQGAFVFLNYNRSRGEALNARDELRGLGIRCEILQANVGKSKDVNKMFELIRNQAGRLDILVNNAGVNRDASILEMTEEMWDDVIETNLKGTFLCSQAAARIMQQGGAIINISSRTGIDARANGSNFCSAKAGIIMLTKCLALELGPTIRVNSVAPGFVLTDEVVERFQLDDDAERERWLSKIPLRKFAQPEDIARAVLYLVGDAGYVTGQTLVVDGGWSLM